MTVSPEHITLQRGKEIMSGNGVRDPHHGGPIRAKNNQALHAQVTYSIITVTSLIHAFMVGQIGESF